MAKQQPNNFLQQSMSIKFLLAPFRWTIVVLMVVLILFAASIISQTYFHQTELLTYELEQTANVFTQGDNNGNTFHFVVSRYCYQALYWLFFDVTGVDTLFESSTNTLQNTMQFVLAGLEPHLDTLNDTLKVLAIRIGNIVAFMPLALVIATVSLTDGLSQRKIRQANAARESAAIYHRAKYWRMGIIWLTCLTYFCSPFPLHPAMLLIPLALLGILIYLQAKYLKKYL